MKYLFATTSLLAVTIEAFPAGHLKDFEVRQLLEARQSLGGADAGTAVLEPIPIFNAEVQYVDVSPGSGHEYVAPSGDDIRGPCPGLNAMANHNFLPHNGYATIVEYIAATEAVVGMGTILAVFLSALGGAIDGDGISWSMGGKPSVTQAGLLGAQANGISLSHNKYESDASPTRGDLYQDGDAWSAKADQFQQLIDMTPSGVISLKDLTDFRSMRFDTQVNSNPYFFNGPFAGVLVQPAAYTFIYRFMANHSDEAPHGELTHDVMASWFGMEKQDDGSYVAKPGQEEIPQNWYKRAIEYPYDSYYLTVDILNAALLYPKFLDIGGNTGEPNTFTGVDVTDLTGGVYNAQNLTQGNNLACLGYQLATQGEPDLALPVVSQLFSSLGQINAQLSCPQLAKIDQDAVFAKYPGYKK